MCFIGINYHVVHVPVMTSGIDGVIYLQVFSFTICHPDRGELG